MPVYIHSFIHSFIYFLTIYRRDGNIRSSRSCSAHAKRGLLRPQDAHHLRGSQTQAGRSRQEREGSSVDCQTSVHRQHVRSSFTLSPRFPPPELTARVNGPS